MNSKPRVLLVSHVWPVPGVSGQQKRVYYMLKTLRSHYCVSFVTYADDDKIAKYGNELSLLCDELILLKSRYNASLLSRVFFKVLSELYAWLTGLKSSNFVIGTLELTKRRIKKATGDQKFQAVIFEYWHAYKSIDRSVWKGVPVVLDMHNILWQTYKAQFSNKSERALGKYKAQEEKAWRDFDFLIAINNEEAAYVEQQLGPERVWNVPMGIDLGNWKPVMNPSNDTPKFAYYGGLASAHNQRAALKVYEEVMPTIWEAFPNLEFWIIGSKPPEGIAKLPEIDKRVIVTGFVEHVAPVLGNIDLVLCPWQGTYGFRSRLIEVMAVGTPIITTEDAAAGMDLENEQGIIFNDNIVEWADLSIDLLKKPERLLNQRKLARAEVEAKYSLERTYNRLPDLLKFAANL